VSVVPGTKIKKVRKILLNAAKAQDRVLAEPAPSVMLRQFGKLGLEFELYVWIEDFRDKYRVESDLATTIDQELQENKVTVAFQSAKVKYKPKGSEEAQLEAAREGLREKRRTVFEGCTCGRNGGCPRTSLKRTIPDFFPHCVTGWHHSRDIPRGGSRGHDHPERCAGDPARSEWRYGCVRGAGARTRGASLQAVVSPFAQK
jgi:hypothetical protein